MSSAIAGSTVAPALLKSAVIRPGNRVLELGCGSGIVSLAAALRAEGVTVHAIDSNARAVECTRRGAGLNGISNLSVELSTAEQDKKGQPADGIADGAFDLALANPPYYSNFRIAGIFARRAAQALKAGGTALFVTKKTEWYEEHFTALFAAVSSRRSGTITSSAA